MTERLSAALRGAAVAALVLFAPAGAGAQAPAPAPITAILVNLVVKPDIPRPDIMKVLPEEVRATVKLYLDGKIAQWYSRGDGRGVMFIVNASSVAEAQALMEGLPLARNKFATFEYTPLAPLSPLRLLLTEPSAPGKEGALP